MEGSGAEPGVGGKEKRWQERRREEIPALTRAETRAPCAHAHTHTHAHSHTPSRPDLSPWRFPTTPYTDTHRHMHTYILQTSPPSRSSPGVAAPPPPRPAAPPPGSDCLRACCVRLLRLQLLLPLLLLLQRLLGSPRLRCQAAVPSWVKPYLLATRPSQHTTSNN